MELKGIEVGKFIFTIPDKWSYEMDEGLFTIYNNFEGEGAIQISNFDIPKEIHFNIFDEFYDFISEKVSIKKDEYNYYKNIKKIKEQFLSIELNVDGRFYIFCMFYHDYSVLFITYNCEWEFRDVEISVVQKFLSNVSVVV